MAADKLRKKSGAKRKKKSPPPAESEPKRLSRGKSREDASFPVAPSRSQLPSDYGKILKEIKRRIGQERLRAVLSANSAMVLLYWDVGRMILLRQERAGWGAKVIDRLSRDLREA